MLGLISKNSSLTIAVVVLYVFALFASDSKLLVLIHNKGIDWGVTIITIAVLVPIVTGEIGFAQLMESFQSKAAWVALGAGLFVALVAKNGLSLLENEPEITAALVMGTIAAVAFFKGVAVGPLIGAGIAYMIYSLLDWFKTFG